MHSGPALITGAASGIGAATARALAAAGAPALILIDRDATGLAAIEAELRPTPTLALVQDVASEEAWEATEAAIRARFGTIATAVVNAGVASGAPITETTLESWRAVTAINLDGAFLTLRTALRLIADGGAIVTVASVAALKAEPGAGAYCASKAGLLHLTRVAARESAPRKIRVNAICPGGVATPLWRTQSWWDKLVESKGSEEAALEAMAVNTPLGRFATPPEIAQQILALLASPITTGSALVVDGGYSL